MSSRRVLVTRAAGQAGKLSEALRAAGFTPVEVPVLEIVPPVSFAPLDQVLLKIQTFHWLILTSTNAVRVVDERAHALGVELVAAKMRIAAVGRATAEAVKALGLNVDVIPEQYVAEGLVAAMESVGRDDFKGKRVLLARAAVARDVIPDALRAAGAEVEIVEAYRNQMPAGAAEQLKTAVSVGLEYAAFTSSSSVRHLREAALAAGIEWPLVGVKAASIGPVTSETLRELGWPVAVEAEVSDVAGLVTVIAGR